MEGGGVLKLQPGPPAALLKHFGLRVPVGRLDLLVVVFSTGFPKRVEECKRSAAGSAAHGMFSPSEAVNRHRGASTSSILLLHPSRRLGDTQVHVQGCLCVCVCVLGVSKQASAGNLRALTRAMKVAARIEGPDQPWILRGMVGWGGVGGGYRP